MQQPGANHALGHESPNLASMRGSDSSLSSFHRLSDNSMRQNNSLQQMQVGYYGPTNASLDQRQRWMSDAKLKLQYALKIVLFNFSLEALKKLQNSD